MKKLKIKSPLAGLTRAAQDWQKRRVWQREQAQWQGRQQERSRDVLRERAVRQRALRWKRVRQALQPRMPALALPKFRMPRFVPSLLAVCLLLSLVGNVLLFFRYSPRRPLVTVGSHVVSRGEYEAVLEQAGGKAALTKIVYAQLVQQAAAQARVEPTGASVDARIKELRQHNPAALAGIPGDALWSNVQTEMALENLRVRGLTVSEADVQAFYQAHKTAFARPASVSGPLVVSDSLAQAKRADALLRQGRSGADLARDPQFHVVGQNGFAINLAAAPPALQAAVGRVFTALPPGQTATLRVGPRFWIMRAARREDAEQPPLADVHDQIVRLLKLQKAPSEAEELQTLYNAHHPVFDMDHYAADFPDMAPPAPSPARKTARVP